MIKRKLLFDLFQDIVVGLAITATVCICLKNFTTLLAFLGDWGLAFVINYVTGLIIPTEKIAIFFAKKLKLKGLGTKITVTAVNSFVYVTVISFAMFAIKVGVNEILLQLMLKTYFFLLPVAFVVGFFMASVSNVLVDKICGVSSEK